MTLIQQVPGLAAQFARCPPRAPATARGAFLVTPEGLCITAESAQDNAYMDTALRIDGERAQQQHRALQRAVAQHLPVVAFPGHPATPDAVFPNNVFATARTSEGGVLLIGRMRHPVRQREAERSDIPAFFQSLMGYRVRDLREMPGLCELTGTMVIDRSRGFGFAGLSSRCDESGAAIMHLGFDLAATFAFQLKEDEYHANVVLSVLAGRAVVLCPDAFVDPAAAEAIAALYAPHAILLDHAEKAAFAGNCIALDGERVWMSEAAADGLAPHNRAALQRAGFAIAAVALDEIEKAGGSLRCCVAEIF